MLQIFHLQNKDNLCFVTEFLKRSDWNMVVNIMRHPGTVELINDEWERNRESLERKELIHYRVNLPLSPNSDLPVA